MFFFEDALYGRTVTVTPSGASVAIDKNVCTGVTEDTG